MKIVGFNFTKISVERLKDKIESLKFNTKIDLSSIESLKSDLFRAKEEFLKINFSYLITYEPEIAKLEFIGTLILAVEPKIAKEILKGWEDKKTSEEFKLFVFNIIFKKANIKALQFEDELNLPPHIPLPSINKGNAKKED
ncbi:hypothetical protein A3K82_00665 [Candidatus Pacearchaeota archaeon RBG_19FT_COMBO_34_9]|nr:MAG: hypothetical protein A3K82_00665 [Candidatus Pacearchaeota archaeon RBG_19FT_COMBO_34_9]OGJ16877.1 MAG: hypothetical protein A3K74_03510 [Candidatus Pacearchaeota archaeon RBG_13_33_26]